jgi:hypothetical protein
LGILIRHWYLPLVTYTLVVYLSVTHFGDRFSFLMYAFLCQKLCEVFEASPQDLNLILAQRCPSQIGSGQTENAGVEAEPSNPVAARQEQAHEFDNRDHSQEIHDQQTQEHFLVSPGSFWIFERTFFFLIIMLLFTPPITKGIRRLLKETQARDIGYLSTLRKQG